MTPSDVETALEYDLRLLKFFPAEPAGGLEYLKSLHAPYAHLGLKYVPLGGVNAKNMKDYLANPMILAVGGSWLAKREQVAAKEWKAITAAAREAVAIAKQAKGA
jgi:2-dehydro-3-deoxyphosphogluconate aldolase/(4S)-4-hydroxy-2-oxoglutarate aldolase